MQLPCPRRRKPDRVVLAGLPVEVDHHQHVVARPAVHPSAERQDVQIVVDVRDLDVLTGQPAGLAAAVYGASDGLRTLVLERLAPGGQVSGSMRVENYLGFPTGLSGSVPAEPSSICHSGTRRPVTSISTGGFSLPNGTGPTARSTTFNVSGPSAPTRSP